MTVALPVAAPVYTGFSFQTLRAALLFYFQGRPGASAEASATLATIRQGLELLGQDEELRELMVLRHRDGLSQDAIAARVGCSNGTVSTRLSRAQAALSLWLRSQGVIQGGSWVDDQRAR